MTGDMSFPKAKTRSIRTAYFVVKFPDFSPALRLCSMFSNL